MALNKATMLWKRSMLAPRPVVASAQTRSLASSTSTTQLQGNETISNDGKANKYLSGEWAPIMVLGGFMAVVMCIAGHSAWQQLAYSPTVNLTKRKRESIPEVNNPDVVVDSADKFVNKSFLRRIGNIQEKRFHDPSIHDAYTRSREIESLKSVGIQNNN